jgi:hypothetical protein
VLGGLWPLVSGRIAKPGVNAATGLSKDIFYVPQKPYTAVGTLRDQLIYPLTAEEAATEMREVEERRGGQPSTSGAGTGPASNASNRSLVGELKGCVSIRNVLGNGGLWGLDEVVERELCW